MDNWWLIKKLKNSCNLAKKQFNKSFNTNIFWHGLFFVRYNEPIDLFKKKFGTDSYKNTYKKYILLEYLKETLHLDYTILELASLQELDLRDSRFATLPAEIGYLTSLQVLNLECKNVSSIPPEIGNLTSLQILNLRNNSLKSIPAEIGNLTSLKYLYLNNNSLTSIPTEIGNLASLKELYLRNNSLTLIPAKIKRLPRLTIY